MVLKKTIHELAKEFPEKTYRELEKYRDADRQEEAQRIFVQQENEELKEDQLTESQKSQDKLEPIGMGHNHPPEETFKKACTLGEMKKDRSYPDLAEVLVQENDKLKKEVEELKEDNKKLAHQIEDRVNNMRKSGM